MESPQHVKKGARLRLFKNDLLELLVTAWGIWMFTCVSVLLDGGKKSLASKLISCVFAALGVAMLCAFIYAVARSIGPQRNLAAVRLGLLALILFTVFEIAFFHPVFPPSRSLRFVFFPKLRGKFDLNRIIRIFLLHAESKFFYTWVVPAFSQLAPHEHQHQTSTYC